MQSYMAWCIICFNGFHRRSLRNFYKDLLIRETVEVFGAQAEFMIWIWSKTYGTSSNDSETIPILYSLMWHIFALGFTGCRMTALKHRSAVWYIDDVAVLMIYWLPGEIPSDTDVTLFNFKKISAFNGAMNLLSLKLDLSYSLNSGLRSMARNKNQSDFNEIDRKYAQRSHVYTYQKSYQSIKKVIILIWYWQKTAITFGEACSVIDCTNDTHLSDG